MATKATLQRNPEMQECIQNCLDCYRVCVETLSYCLQQGGKHADATHIGVLKDCADICLTSANFMLHGSTRHKSTCRVCAEVCNECATSCEQFANDNTMQACAGACRRCAQSCQQMVA